MHQREAWPLTASCWQKTTAICDIILAETLREQGHQVNQVADGNRLAEALGAVLVGGQLAFDLVVADLHMPGWSALGLLDVLRSRPGCPPFILMSGFGDEADRGRARRLGALGLLEKPFSPRALLAHGRRFGSGTLRVVRRARILLAEDDDELAGRASEHPRRPGPGGERRDQRVRPAGSPGRWRPVRSGGQRRAHAGHERPAGGPGPAQRRLRHAPRSS